MRQKLPMPAIGISVNDHQASIGTVNPRDEPLNAATRYLSAAAHLRKAMLPVQIGDARRLSKPIARAPHPVGRSYALRVLLSAEGVVPMPAVDVQIVKRNCRAALRQTLVRDSAALGVLTVTVLTQPLGTLIAVLLFLVLLLATARRKVRSAVPTGTVLAILLATIAVNPSPRNPFFAPLIAFAAIFLLATADVTWSAHRVRGLWRQTSAAPTEMSSSNVVYYNKHGFIGSGIASSAFPLTIPLDKAKDKAKPVHGVTAAKLLAYIGSHLASQGVSDGRPHGYAHDPAATTSLPAEPAPAYNKASPQHFTYGLPYLDVEQVVAVPQPPIRKVPFTRFRPYLIAPIDGDLKTAESLVGRSRVALTLACLVMTARQFLRTSERVGGIARGRSNPRQESAEAEPVKPGLLSIRERYAQPATDNIYHSEDAARLITVMEEKVIRATMRYLDICNVDVNEAEDRIMNTFVQNTINGAGNIIVDSTISQSTMTATSGQGNVTTNGPGGSR